MFQNNQKFRAFTLVELLVVITIIGILIALLLPAVQAAREAARQVQCKNNLKQLALGCLNYEEVHKFFPTGGWGHSWLGEPEYGFDKEQPGGWAYNILPFIEQQALHDLGAGASGSVKTLAMRQLVQTPLTVFNCPTRRGTALTPFPYPGNYWLNLIMPDQLFHNDYAVNFGDTVSSASCFRGPSTIAEGNSWSPAVWQATWQTNCSDSGCSGISFVKSEIMVAQITDGLSSTYLLGEKNVNPDHYFTGYDWGDDSSLFTGQQDDIYRSTGYLDSNGTYVYYPPVQDTPGNMLNNSFGSAHATVCHFAMCDGSVHGVNYTIDPEVHRLLSNREDGQTIDGKAF